MWADVPEPGNMADFDRDTEDEETPALVDPDKRKAGRESWWDLDDWGDEE